ncbi:MerR family transcriptional regulator [Streptomyces qinglanensis]|uniref:DNA-binding transcriptional regulator, MerR family n=1 Tax=Streptomyces qinglanensis TaxID=943816 RepID=A0A1H9Q277_9ACTN|nr:MerR family transcriptional regulator [Streptomyces qinglanensis]SER54540.1 DNA-binding transcriptional regulator, MerR family [Streptomyces qinglanensis]
MPPSPHPAGPTSASTSESEYRIEDLAQRSGATVRTIRAYQDKGLLPKPGRRGRANVYDDSHLARLQQIADLLERGYTLASIRELLQAWDEGRGLAGVLGLVTEVDGPWTDEVSGRISRADLGELFGGKYDEEAVSEALALGVLEPLPDREDEFRVPSPQELSVAAELHKAGVPLLAITEQLRELRGQVEHIAARFLDFTNEHVFVRYLGVHLSDGDASEAADLVRRLRPLAQQTVEAELARAMQKFAARNLRDHLRSAAAAPTGPEPADPTDPARTAQIRLPTETVEAVGALVGEERVPDFIAAAAEREVRARQMDRMSTEGR